MKKAWKHRKFETIFIRQYKYIFYLLHSTFSTIIKITINTNTKTNKDDHFCFKALFNY